MHKMTPWVCGVTPSEYDILKIYKRVKTLKKNPALSHMDGRASSETHESMALWVLGVAPFEHNARKTYERVGTLQNPHK